MIFDPLLEKVACTVDELKRVEMIMEKSVELNIKLDTKTTNGSSTFHLACQTDGYFELAKMLMQKSAKFNIKV